MARKLPVNPDKRRREYIKRIFQHLQHFHALMECGEMELVGIVTTPEGEEVFLSDLMIGIESLPPRQRQAFELICLKSYTESAATAIMLPESKWSTPIQQYADAALDRMIKAYDCKQEGTWDPQAIKKRKPKHLNPKEFQELHHDCGIGFESGFGIALEPVAAGGIPASQAAATA
jgi:hypothetical protein